jgi:uncharacterized protein (TIGR00299 family) protein
VIGYLDCSTGVSGDKFLGALLDVGSADGRFTAGDLGRIAAELAPEARVAVDRVDSHGLSAIGVRVSASEEPHARTWADIRALLGGSGLPEPVRERAMDAFAALAKAEAAVHGTAADDVHFHEVGAIDSIVDIVGVCAGLQALGIDQLICSPVAVGSGSVETSHGTLPVPAPATARLLRGVPIVSGPADGELTTPTGAALLAAFCAQFSSMPPLRIGRIGYGAGTRDIGSPNVCRIILAEETVDDAVVPSALSAEIVALLETNLDHLAPEELAFACEELLAAGALDVWQTPIVMKKGRSAAMLSVLAAEEDAVRLTERVSELTGSLGVRVTFTERRVAPRAILQVDTEWGVVPIKSGAGRLRPEHEDVARIARESGLPYAEVVRAIVGAAGKPAVPKDR